MVRSIDPRRVTLRQFQWLSQAAAVLGTHRGNHLGQRSRATAPKGRTYGSKRSDQIFRSALQEGAVHIWNWQTARLGLAA
jgi:hypothetical protein